MARERWAVTVPGAIPSTLAVVSVSRSSRSRRVITSRWRAGRRPSATITPVSMPSLGWSGEAGSCPARGTSRRRRRHHDTRVFTAVRTTHATGAGCRLTFAQDLQARAKASATSSSARCGSTPLAATARRHLSLFVS